MFNPFKKKDDFKLDDISLPSLSGMPNSDSSASLPSLGSLNDNTSSSLSLDNSNAVSSQSPTSPFGDNLSNNNSFNALANATPTFSNSSNPMQQNLPVADNSMQSEIIKSKLESIETKFQLNDARMNSIEQKLELIYQMLLNEISDDTKQKLNMNNMINSVRNK